MIGGGEGIKPLNKIKINVANNAIKQTVSGNP
jgi:hypothetical protein